MIHGAQMDSRGPGPGFYELVLHCTSPAAQNSTFIFNAQFSSACSLKHHYSQLVKAMDITFKKQEKISPTPSCHVTHVSVYCVMCDVSHVFFWKIDSLKHSPREGV